MYVTLLERLIEPILLDKICEVEIRELVEKNHYDLILMVPKSLISVLIGKKRKYYSCIINNYWKQSIFRKQYY